MFISTDLAFAYKWVCLHGAHLLLASCDMSELNTLNGATISVKGNDSCGSLLNVGSAWHGLLPSEAWMEKVIVRSP